MDYYYNTMLGSSETGHVILSFRGPHAKKLVRFFSNKLVGDKTSFEWGVPLKTTQHLPQGFPNTKTKKE